MVFEKEKVFGSRIAIMQCMVTKFYTQSKLYTNTHVLDIYWSDRIEKSKND